MLKRSAGRHDFHPDRVAADGSFGTGPFLGWLLERHVTPHIPVLDRKHQTNGKYDISHFQYDAERDSFTCLEGHEMPLRRIKKVDRIKSYFASKEMTLTMVALLAQRKPDEGQRASCGSAVDKSLKIKRFPGFGLTYRGVMSLHLQPPCPPKERT